MEQWIIESSGTMGSVCPGGPADWLNVMTLTIFCWIKETDLVWLADGVKKMGGVELFKVTVKHRHLKCGSVFFSVS